MQVGLKRAGDRSEEAARALVATLKKNNIDAHMFPAIDLPVNTLRVRIGLKPITHSATLEACCTKDLTGIVTLTSRSWLCSLA